MKPADVKLKTCVDFNKKNNENILNLELVIMLEYQNI